MAIAGETTQDLTTLEPKFKTERRPIWCAGCGDFGVLSALANALEQSGFERNNTVLVSGIGCSSRLPFFVPSFGFHSVHGRALPIAMGVKLGNPALNVVAVGGDGDGLGIGGGHIPHAARRNPNLTYLILDNAIYGLTKGQASPTSIHEQKTSSTPYGVIDAPIDPILQYLSYDVSFIGRGFSARTDELVFLLTEALRHRGLSIVHIASPCPTYGGQADFKYFEAKMKPLPESFDPADRLEAFRYALDRDTIWSGIYRRDVRPTYDALLQDVGLKAIRAGSSSTTEDLLKQFT
jgi:2-oxoglutarate ferredoxin oxidoreductase subunit beta